MCGCGCIASVDVLMSSGAPGARNVDALLFMLWWAWGGIHKKRIGTHYVELVFLHQVGYVGHVMHSYLPGAQNVDTLYFMLRWAWGSIQKSAPGHVTPNFCFGIWWDLRVM
jgi:hypothetical protein